MPRTVSVLLPSSRTDALVEQVQALDGLLTLQVVRGAAVQPPGDSVTVEVTDTCMPKLMHVLDRHGAGSDGRVSVTMNEAVGMVSASASEQIMGDPASSTLEEMQFMLARESRMGVNKVMVMATSGVIAAAGIATNAIHLVVGAMVIAPGFEPLLRLSLGAVNRHRVWRYGAIDTAKAYGALLAGAGLTMLVLPLLGVNVPAGDAGYLTPHTLVQYWSSVTTSATVVAVAGGVAGALLVAANRSVLTAGVMIALALVPSATLTAAGLVTGDLDLAARAGVRWLHDAAIVVATGLLVLGTKVRKRGRRLGG